MAAITLVGVVAGCSGEVDTTSAETTPEGAPTSEAVSSTTVTETSKTTAPPAPAVNLTSVPADSELINVVPAGYGWFGREPQGRDLLRSTDGLVWEPIETQPYQTMFTARLIPIAEGYLKIDFNGELTEPILFTPDGITFTEYDDPDGLIPDDAGFIETLGPAASLTEDYSSGMGNSYPSWPCFDSALWSPTRTTLFTEAGEVPVKVRTPWEFTRHSFLFEGGFGVLIDSPDGPFCDGKQTARLGVWVWRAESGFELALEFDDVPEPNLAYYGLEPDVVMTEDGRAIVAAKGAPYISTDATLTEWIEIELPGPMTTVAASPFGRALVAQESIGGRVWAMRLDGDWVELPLDEPVLVRPIAADANAVILEDVGSALLGRQRIRAEW